MTVLHFNDNDSRASRAAPRERRAAGSAARGCRRRWGATVLTPLLSAELTEESALDSLPPRPPALEPLRSVRETAADADRTRAYDRIQKRTRTGRGQRRFSLCTARGLPQDPRNHRVPTL
eukprot:gene13415-biopygen15583